MKALLVAAAIVALGGCAPAGGPNSRTPDLQPALDGITARRLLTHIRVLSSDEFEGRRPGTSGEELTINYLTQQFQAIGLEPGNPNGTYLQEVPLAGHHSSSALRLTAGGRPIPMKPLEDYVAISRHLTSEVDVHDAAVVFVGYGVVAPEYGWDDYKGVDVKGKTLLMLVNDPPVPDPSNPAMLDPGMFKGRAMTYYGRWTYKYEIAAKKGAAAALIIHETGPAGYPWAVVRSSWSGENFDIRTPDDNLGAVPVEGWITLAKARELLQDCGQDFDRLKQAAARKDFHPVPLPATASFRITNTLREVDSHNVIGKLTGSDPVLQHEYVLYTAHWDHLGRDPSLPGDQIYNGAEDNASGTAALIEIARAFTKLSRRPKRTLLFLATTGEEQGLLGAKYYVENPLYPLNKTLADINIDGVNPWGRTRDITVIGLGNSTLDDVVRAVAHAQGRVVRPDPEPEKGFFYRADHFEFARMGVPALYTDSGVDYLGRPAGWGQKKRAEFTAHDYHKVSDEIKPGWDLSGAVEDVRLLFRVGFRVAEAKQWPAWKPGTEFRAKREAMRH